jgi:hypothetical protein
MPVPILILSLREDADNYDGQKKTFTPISRFQYRAQDDEAADILE